MDRVKISLILAALVVFTVSAFSVERTHDIVYQDYFTQVFIDGIDPSPDGNEVAYVQWHWVKENDNRNRDIWVVNNKTKETKRLTFDARNETTPHWSADGNQIYFIGHYKNSGETKPPYDGSAQVWRINKDGSNLMAVTQIPDGIDSYNLSKDTKNLYYTVSKEHLIDEWKDLRSQYKNDLIFGHGINTVSELWVLNLETWRKEKLMDDNSYIWTFDVSPDGQKVAAITSENDLNITHEGWTDIKILNIADNSISTLPNDIYRGNAPTPYGWLEEVAWSTNGDKVAFNIGYDGYPTELYTFDFDAAGNATNISKVTLPPVVTLVGNLNWYPGKDIICFLAEYKAREHVYGVNVTDNSHMNYTPGDVVVNNYKFSSKKNDIVVIQSELTYHRDIVLYRGKKGPERITNVNPQVDTWKLPQISIVEWTGANGDKVEGVLELPYDYKEGDKLPLIVNIHGGPTASETYSFMFWIYGRTALAAKGYAVLSPNYRGSTGYGDKFLTDLVGHENDYDVIDIMAGIDYLIAEGIADPEKLGAMGWSNGGYLSNCLIATNRFKAISTGAGVIDMTMQFGEEDTPGHVINYMQGFPWEKADHYQKASPIYDLHPGIKTAVLIHQGENDPRVPETHSKTLHRALHYYLDAPCELVIYPGAHHSVYTYTYRMAKMDWDHAWFDKYLGTD